MNETANNDLQSYPPPAAFLEACQAIGIELEETEITKLGQYIYLLLETNKKFNLTAIKDPDVAWMRHVLDSLGLLSCTSDAKSLIDIGSGGGLPGIPLAITQPHLKITLLETTGKKARYLQEVADQLGLSNVTVVNDRAETAAHEPDKREQFDLATARAVGPLPVLLEFTMPFVRIGGAVLAIKGSKAEEELKEASHALEVFRAGEIMLLETLPGLDDESVIIRIEKEKKTFKMYPRLPGIPKKEPL